VWAINKMRRANNGALKKIRVFAASHAEDRAILVRLFSTVYSFLFFKRINCLKASLSLPRLAAFRLR
jgi:hypothetical protein